MLNVDGAALHPTKAGELLSKFRKLAIPFLVVLGGFLQHADPPHALARLLRARPQRPRCCCAAEQRDKIASAQHDMRLSSRHPMGHDPADKARCAAVRRTQPTTRRTQVLGQLPGQSESFLNRSESS